MGYNPQPPKPPKPPRVRKDGIAWGSFINEEDDDINDDAWGHYDPYGKDEVERHMEQLKDHDPSMRGMLKEVCKEISKQQARTKVERQIIKFRNLVLKILIACILMAIMSAFLDPILFPEEKEKFESTVKTETGVTQSKVNTGNRIGGE